MSSRKVIEQLRSLIVDVPDFPKSGVLFKDITPLLADPASWHLAIEQMADSIAPHQPDSLLAVESRGFIFGAALGLYMKLGFHIVRKPGKLPRTTRRITYDLEYGQDALEMHSDGVNSGERIAIVDDVLATGGTANAVGELVEALGGQVACYSFLIELDSLAGREKLVRAPIESIVRY